MTTLKLYYAPPVQPANPLGARAAAAAFTWVLAALQPLTDRLATRREAARARGHAKEVVAVRALAWQVRPTDRRFADDLAAAADRYDLLHGR